MKVCVIGAGSSYTPELVEGLLAERESIPLTRLTLMDIDSERLGILGALVERMVAAADSPFRVDCSTDLAAAVDGADFVTTQIRVGGQQARHDDTVLALAHGMIGQETTGVAGFAKAMRTIPVLLEVCREMRRRAPGATLINFTNPAGLVTEALLKHGGVRSIGLCNIPIGIRMATARRYGVTPSQVDLDYVGLNHFAWLRRVVVAGRDVTEEALAEVLAKTPADLPANLPAMEYGREFIEALGMVPSGYLRYFYLQHEMLEHLRAKERTRAQEVMEIDATLLAKYRDPGLSEKPAELEKRGGAFYSTAAVSLIRSMVSNDGARHIVNVENGSSLPDLPPDSAVEVPAVVGAGGAAPLAMGRLETPIRGWIQLLKSYEILTVEAAVERSYKKALLALSCNPLVPSVNKAKALLDALDERHGLHLT
jgi:6-phospho-beta-glucosidase